MIRLLTPIIIIAAAAGIFFTLTDPLVNGALKPAPGNDPTIIDGGIVALREEKAKLNATLENAQELAKQVDRLTSVYNSFPQEKLDRLDALLPDTVDNVQLIIDINNIAKTHGMEIKNIKVKTEEEKTQTSVISRPGSMEQGSVTLGFSVSGPYEVFQSFLVDLAKSLRIVDIVSVNLTPSGDRSGNYQYSVEIKTYWLK